MVAKSHSPLRHIWPILLGIGLTLPLLCFADDDEKTRQSLEKVRRDITRLQQDVRETQQQHDSVQQEVLKLERELASLSAELRKLNQKLRRQEGKLNKLYGQRRELRKDVAAQHRLLASQIRSSYMLGRQEYLKILLNMQDSAAVGRTIVYYDYFNKARLSRIDSANQTLASLQDLEKVIQKQTTALRETREEQIKNQAELRKVSESRAVVVAQLHQALVNKQQDLSGLREDEQRLEKLLSDLDRAIPDILTDPGKRTPFAQLKGKLHWPAQGELKDYYGKRKVAGRLKWNGVMIMASEGRDVRAVSHGRVAFADFLRGYGLLLIIDHGDGYMSLYGHNQAIYKEIGEWVESGEAIASIGTSGGQQHAGLYFEIRHNGKPTDPGGWCRKS